MTNEEKAKEIACLCTSCIESNGQPCVGCMECESRGKYCGALEMAEWKDQQIKEYLVKKRDSLEMDYHKDSYEGNSYKYSILMEIINELFKKD